jgi:hypothetical protein
MADLLDPADFPELFQVMSTQPGPPSVSGLDVDVLLHQELDPDTLDFSATFNPADWEPWILTRGRRRGTQVFRHLVNRKYYRDTLPEGYGLIGTQILSTLSSKEYDVREVDVRVLDQASRILGRPVTIEQLARLAGAFPGDRIRGTVPVGRQTGIAFRVTGSKPVSYSSRRILEPGPPPHLLNAGFNVDHEEDWGKGLATRMLVTQVNEAVKLGGLAYITTFAAGEGDGYRHKRSSGGYYTWARLGYNARIDDEMARDLREPYKSAETLHELMAMPGGPDHWLRYGKGFTGMFSLGEGSRSLAILRTYASAKGLTVAFAESDPDTLDFSRSFNPADWQPWTLTRGRRQGTQVFRHLVNRKMYRDTLPEGYEVQGQQIVPVQVASPGAIPPVRRFPTAEELNAGFIRKLNVGDDIQTGSSPVFKVRVGAQDWFVKQVMPYKSAQDQPFSLDNEVLISQAAQEAGVPAAEVASTTFLGKKAIVTPWYEGKALIDFPDYEDVLARRPPQEIAQHAAFAYLAGIIDRHLGNYFLTSAGRLLAIDHELLQYSGYTDRSLIDHNELVDYNPHRFLLSADMVARLLTCVPSLLQGLESSGRTTQADGVRQRAADLEQVAKLPHATLLTLRDLASSRGAGAPPVHLSTEPDPDTIDFSRAFNPADWQPWTLTRGRRQGTQVFRHLVNRKMYRDTLPEGYTHDGTQVLPVPGGPTAPPVTQEFPFPTADELNAGAVRHLHVGDVYVGGHWPAYQVTVGGQQYFVKKVFPGQPEKAAVALANEVLISQAAQKAGVPVLPVTVLPFQGEDTVREPSLVSTWQAGEALADLLNGLAKLEALPKDVISRHVAFAYLAGIRDRHLGNYFLTSDGKLLTIDHEMLQDADFYEDRYLISLNGLIHDTPLSYPLSSSLIQQILTSVPILQQGLHAAGREDQVQRVKKRARDLEQVARIPNATLQHLLDLASS